MQEIWKDIKGFEGRYQVSNLGNIKSLPIKIKQKSNGGGFHYQTLRGKILIPVPNSKGYLRVVLRTQEKREVWFVHRLVATHFVENPNNKPIVNHIDNVHTNNVANNLEWCTHQENLKHAVGIKGIWVTKGEERENSILTEEDVRWIKENAIKGDKILGYKSLSKKFGVSPQHIGNIIRGKKWSHVK